MKMARMVLRCGLVVLLCIALTPFCVLADEARIRSAILTLVYLILGFVYLVFACASLFPRLFLCLNIFSAFVIDFSKNRLRYRRPQRI